MLNKKLEETAQAIYKQWFVDFEFPYSPPLEGWQAKPDGVVPLEGCPTGGVINSPSSENGVVPLEGCPTGGASSENRVVPFKRNTQNYLALPYNPKLKERAKALRKAGVLSEVLFWQQVHKRKFKGLDFDRQKIIGNYIVDFYCPNQNVVIEIDGSSHDNKQEYDAERDVYLKGLGLTVIRIKDIDVKKNLQGVMDRLGDHPAFQARSDHPARWAPLQRRGIGYKSSGGKMVWNEELGKEIPEGWKNKKIEGLIKYNYASYNKNDNYKSITYLDTSSITNNRIDELQTLNIKTDSIPSRAKRKVSHNDIVYSTIRPNLKHYGIIKNPTENMLVSTGFMVIQSKEENISNELLYIWLSKDDVIDYLQSKAEMSVSTYPSIKPEDILDIDVLIPNEESVLIKTNQYFSDIFNSQWKRNNENKQLLQLKNILLSRMAKG